MIHKVEFFEGLPDTVEKNRLHIWNQHEKIYQTLYFHNFFQKSLSPLKQLLRGHNDPPLKMADTITFGSSFDADSKYIFGFLLLCQEGP